MTTEYSSRMSAEDFFLGVVPEMANRKAESTALNDAQKAVKHTIALRLRGDEAGEWSFTLDGGKIDAAAGIHEAANPIVSLEAQTWRDAMEGINEVLGDLLAFERLTQFVEQADLAGLDPELLDMLEPMTGYSVSLKITDADDTTIMVQFGSAAPESPSTTITVDPSTAEKIASGRLQPTSAFMSGQLMLDGDMNIAMLMAGFIPKLMEAFQSTGIQID